MTSQNPHIGILTTGLTGMTNACIEMGRRLRSNKSAVTFFGGPKVCSIADQQGFKSTPIPQIEPYLNRQSYYEIGLGKRIASKILGNTRQIHDALIESLKLPQFIDRIIQSNLDILLIDAEMHEFIIPLLGRDIKIVLISPWYYGGRAAGLPPLTSLAVPSGNGTNEQLAFDSEWNSFLTRERQTTFRATKRADTINRIAEIYSFDLARRTTVEHWPPPFGYKDVTTISLTAREMEFPFDAPDHFKYVGPMINLNRGAPDTVGTFDPFEGTHTNGRLIYSVASTVPGEPNPIIHQICEAAREMPTDRFIIVSNTVTPADTPKNVHIADFAPQIEVLKIADCCIHHGGIHTIHECVQLGVPMIIYSGNRFDQNGCTARVNYHKLGVGSDRHGITARKIKQEIDLVTSDHSPFRQNMALMQDVFEHYRSDMTFEHIIATQINS